MGRIYALEDGIAEEVAQAIYEHWLPRHAGDELPQSKPGILLALADRLDSLVGLMGVGLSATDFIGSLWPARRSALGMIRMLIEREIDISFQGLFETAKLKQPFHSGKRFRSKKQIPFFHELERLYHWLRIEESPDTELSERVKRTVH